MQIESNPKQKLYDRFIPYGISPNYNCDPPSYSPISHGKFSEKKYIPNSIKKNNYEKCLLANLVGTSIESQIITNDPRQNLGYINMMNSKRKVSYSKEKSQEKGFTELSEAIENCFSIIIDGQYIGKRYSIKNAVIPDSVKRIADGVFSACSNLMSVTIPDSVTEIGSFAFRSCQSLTSVTMPANVTSIGKYAFEGCTSLGNITIPESVTEIGSHAFFCCTSLKKLTLFGCTVNSTLWNWDKVDPNEVKSMLASKDYSVKMDRPTKYMFVTQIFLNTAQPEAEAYIKKNAMKIIKWLIDADDYKTVKGLFESGKFVTKHNIMKFIDHSIAHTQSGGDIQLQAYIMDYKNEHFS